MNEGDLYIEVKVYGGAHIPQVITQMVALASRLQISIWAELNGVRTLARPTDDPARIVEGWEEAGRLKRTHASAS